MTSQRRLANEGGIALAIVLLILAVVLLLGTTLIALSVTEDRAGSIVANMKKAFSAAEAGIQEAMYRMRLNPNTLPYEGVNPGIPCAATADPGVVGYVQGTPPNAVLAIPSPDPTNANFWKYNPPACSWIYAGSSAAGYGNYLGGTAANLDSAGRIFTSSGSSHAAGGALVNATLSNTVSDPRTYTVTVAPVVGFVGGCWQYVNPSGAPLGSCTSVAPNPMFKVTSTGTARSATKTLSSMIQRFKVSPKLDGAITANSDVHVHSDKPVVDGHNFDCDGNNASDSDSIKAATVPSGDKLNADRDQDLQCAAGSGDVCKGTSSPFPSTLGALLLGPTAPTAEVQALDAYLGSIAIDPVAHPEKLPTSAFHGILYVTGDYKNPPDGSSGVLIIHNVDKKGHYNAKLQEFQKRTFKGLIIADWIEKMNTDDKVTSQVIGGMIALRPTDTNDVDHLTNIKYSKCVIAGLSKYFPFRNVPGTWHEQ